jgi:hypothetical protein
MPTLAVGSFVVFCALCMVVMNCYGGGYGTISVLVGTYYGARGSGRSTRACTAPRPSPASARRFSWHVRRTCSALTIPPFTQRRG